MNLRYGLNLYNNYLINPIRFCYNYWLGTDIPREWTFNSNIFIMFYYPQLPEDSIVNENLIQDGEYSMRITGDFT